MELTYSKKRISFFKWAFGIFFASTIVLAPIFVAEVFKGERSAWDLVLLPVGVSVIGYLFFRLRSLQRHEGPDVILSGKGLAFPETGTALVPWSSINAIWAQEAQLIIKLNPGEIEKLGLRDWNTLTRKLDLIGGDRLSISLLLLNISEFELLNEIRNQARAAGADHIDI
ncbi:hypothetical protein [Roseibium sp.]|uniref:hypothetical protein n=1 Tax=Roseibium sp. TaxID=1936156 RepID=UPI003BB08672